MIPLTDLLLTPAPNMIYLISRSICQGRAAGVFSLFGVLAGMAAKIATEQRHVA